jgi:hypothetical protein
MPKINIKVVGISQYPNNIACFYVGINFAWGLVAAKFTFAKPQKTKK